MTEPVKVFSTSTCAPCVSLIRFLEYKGIPFQKQVIDDDEQSRKLVVAMTGRFLMPTCQIGDKWISGYNPSQIMEAVSE